MTCLSDTHELHREVTLPSGDLLIFAGDLTFFSRRPAVVEDFNDWLGEQRYTYKVIIPGNHDTLLESVNGRRKITNGHLLINSGLDLGGLKVWGSPNTHLSAGAFATPDDVERSKVWGKIPSDTDILVTHIPPFGILDGEPGSDYHGGCPKLREEVKRIRPRIHVFGHVHTGAGLHKTKHTVFVNASLAGPLGDLDKEPTLLRLEPLSD